MPQISLRALLLVAVFGATPSMAAAGELTHLRVMLHPMVDSVTALAGLESDAGTSFTVTGMTRTGALEIVLPAPPGGAESRALLQRLRNDRNVLWVEASASTAAANRQSIQKAAGPELGVPGRKLMVRLRRPRRPTGRRCCRDGRRWLGNP